MEVTIEEKKPRAAGDGGGLVDRLPEALLVEVLARVDVDGACSAAASCRSLYSTASCRSLYSAANAVLPALTSIDLSEERMKQYQTAAKRLDNALLVLRRFISTGNELCTPVTKDEIVSEVARQLNINIHPENLHLHSPLASLGEFELPLRLPQNIPCPEASCLKSSRPNTIVLSGLSGSGKTTIYYQKDKVKHVHVIDVPGHARLKPTFDEVLPKVAAVVFVVDAQDFLSSMQAAAE
ncbi:hypothetical protein Zm00014a_011361 [Zea mays]|uniref:50S ribosomal protein L9, chloroplastic n=1 Tax=Zea mays TaxID=4577 RepID=A0A3L6F8A7_MAIZE|nr:hypothetical protein Zm00014a_011361 [Zea mays]